MHQRRTTHTRFLLQHKSFTLSHPLCRRHRLRQPRHLSYRRQFTTASGHPSPLRPQGRHHSRSRTRPTFTITRTPSDKLSEAS
ncbi:hypothetical protein MTO96_004108 [Rhipicephalus appendiculatus]